MAQKIETRWIDDLDADQTADETVTFGLDGSWFDIDLSADHAGELREALSEYVSHARKAPARRSRQAQRKPQRRAQPSAGRTQPTIDREQRQAIREWGRKNGWPNLSNRGRIPADLVAAYEGSKAKARQGGDSERTPAAVLQPEFQGATG